MKFPISAVILVCFLGVTYFDPFAKDYDLPVVSGSALRNATSVDQSGNHTNVARGNEELCKDGFVVCAERMADHVFLHVADSCAAAVSWLQGQPLVQKVFKLVNRARLYVADRHSMLVSWLDRQPFAQEARKYKEVFRAKLEKATKNLFHFNKKEDVKKKQEGDVPKEEVLLVGAQKDDPQKEKTLTMDAQKTDD